MIIKNLTQLNVLSFRVCLRILFVTNKNMGLSLEDYQRQRVKSLHLHLHKIIGFRLQISEGIKRAQFDIEHPSDSAMCVLSYRS
jgi:hypothetical protein